MTRCLQADTAFTARTMPIRKSLRQVNFATRAPIVTVWHLAPSLRCNPLLAGDWTAAAAVNVLNWTS